MYENYMSCKTRYIRRSKKVIKTINGKCLSVQLQVREFLRAVKIQMVCFYLNATTLLHVFTANGTCWKIRPTLCSILWIWKMKNNAQYLRFPMNDSRWRYAEWLIIKFNTRYNDTTSHDFIIFLKNTGYVYVRITFILKYYNHNQKQAKYYP